MFVLIAASDMLTAVGVVVKELGAVVWWRDMTHDNCMFGWLFSFYMAVGYYSTTATTAPSSSTWFSALPRPST